MPEVRKYVKAIRDAATPQAAVALVARLDQDPRTLWAVQAAYGSGGRSLAADLRDGLSHVGLSEEIDYVDHVFAQPPTESASWTDSTQPAATAPEPDSNRPT